LIGLVLAAVQSLILILK